MSPTNPLLKLTYRDYLLLPSESRYELMDGDLFMVPSPNRRHQTISRRLEYELISFVEERNLGEIFDAPFDVVLSIHNVVQPDIIFVSNERSKIVTEKNIQGPPDLVIEILSPVTADIDLNLKRILYGKLGVREYWIVNPETETIELCRANPDGVMETQRIFLKTDILISPTFPGLQMDLTKIFR